MKYEIGQSVNFEHLDYDTKIVGLDLGKTNSPYLIDLSGHKEFIHAFTFYEHNWTKQEDYEFLENLENKTIVCWCGEEELVLSRQNRLDLI